MNLEGFTNKSLKNLIILGFLFKSIINEFAFFFEKILQ